MEKCLFSLPDSESEEIQNGNRGSTVKILRSRRKTLGLQINDRGELLARVPLQLTEQEIAEFLRKHSRWIQTHREIAVKHLREVENVPPLTEEEMKSLRERAAKVIPERVRYYAPLVGVTYGRITIRNQHTRWGSCSARGNLNFNCLLMLAPEGVLDSVVVHELCHRKEMNHSRRFYQEVLRVYPSYWKWHGWLKENGNVLMLKNRK